MERIKERLTGKLLRRGLPDRSHRGHPPVPHRGSRRFPGRLECAAETIGPFGSSERMLARGKPGKVVMTALSRKLLHLVYGVWKHQQDYDLAKAFPA